VTGDPAGDPAGDPTGDLTGGLTGDPRSRLVAAAVELLGREGIGDRSLRSLAESLGTSHRMLLYHFGSRDGLLAAVTSAVEERQLRVLAAAYDEQRPPLEAAADYWEQVVTETLRYGPLFFELAAHAMQGRPHAASLRSELIGAWLPPLAALVRRLGVPEDQAEAHARLALGAARGLLLDLLVSGDREGVTEAADLLNRLLLASATSAESRPGRSNGQPPG
jgi:AcrR family transcriptional regulator